MKVKKQSKAIDTIFDEATTNLNLEGMAINAANLESVSEKLLKKDGVKVLNLSNNKLGKERLSRLYKAMTRLPNLEELDLSGNILSAKGLKDVKNIIESAKNLKKLNLSNNNIGLSSKDHHRFSNFTKTIANHPALESLDLSKNYLERDKLTLLISALEKHITLRELNLSGNQFDEHGSHLISGLLAKNQKLTSLYIAFNKVKIPKSPGLYNLKFSIFVEPILSALKENCSLQILDLSGIKLHIRELELIKEVLEKNTTLITIKWNEKPNENEAQQQERISELSKEIHTALEKNTRLSLVDSDNSDSLEKMSAHYQRDTL